MDIPGASAVGRFIGNRVSRSSSKGIRFCLHDGNISFQVEHSVRDGSFAINPIKHWRDKTSIRIHELQGPASARPRAQLQAALLAPFD
jgi:hypothetical protein